MRMADRDCCCISCIIWLGHCWQVEKLSHHIPHLFLTRSAIASDGQLHLTGSVLCNSQSSLHQREECNTAGLCYPYGRCHISAKEQFLHGCLTRVIAGND